MAEHIFTPRYLTIIAVLLGVSVFTSFALYNGQYTKPHSVNPASLNQDYLDTTAGNSKSTGPSMSHLDIPLTAITMPPSKYCSPLPNKVSLERNSTWLLLITMVMVSRKTESGRRTYFLSYKN